MSNLFNISGDLISLRTQIESENEFADDSAELGILEEQLVIKQEELGTKVQGYLELISQAEGQKEMADREIIRAKAFADTKERVADRLKASLLQALLLFGEEDSKGIKRLEVGSHRLSTRRNKSVKIMDEESLPDDVKVFDVIFKGLNVEMKNFIANRIKNLPDSEGKSALTRAFDPGTKISKTLIKDKLNDGIDVDGAEIEIKYGLTIK